MFGDRSLTTSSRAAWPVRSLETPSPSATSTQSRVNIVSGRSAFAPQVKPVCVSDSPGDRDIGDGHPTRTLRGRVELAGGIRDPLSDRGPPQRVGSARRNPAVIVHTRCGFSGRALRGPGSARRRAAYRACSVRPASSRCCSAFRKSELAAPTAPNERPRHRVVP